MALDRPLQDDQRRRHQLAVAPNVDLDVGFTALAYAIYKTLQRRLPDTGGHQRQAGDHLSDRLTCGTYSPVIRAANLHQTDAHWSGGRTCHHEITWKWGRAVRSSALSRMMHDVKGQDPITAEHSVTRWRILRFQHTLR